MTFWKGTMISKPYDKGFCRWDIDQWHIKNSCIFSFILSFAVFFFFFHLQNFSLMTVSKFFLLSSILSTKMRLSIYYLTQMNLEIYMCIWKLGPTTKHHQVTNINWHSQSIAKVLHKQRRLYIFSLSLCSNTFHSGMQTRNRTAKNVSACYRTYIQRSCICRNICITDIYFSSFSTIL